MHLGSEVPGVVMDVWRQGGKTYDIGLVELYACMGACDVGRRLLLQEQSSCVDSWTALGVLVKGTSLQEDWCKLLLLLKDPSKDSFLLWVARVPPSSNVDEFFELRLYLGADFPEAS